MTTRPFLVDPSLPQLEVAGDPEFLRDVFQRHLLSLSEKTYQVRDCRVSYIRYRRAKRCMLQYTLRLAELDTGRAWSQWVTGWMYAGDKTRRRWKKLQRSLSKQEAPGVALDFAPFSYISNPEMLVQVFPYDRKLSALPLLMAGPLPELEPLLLARFGPGDWRDEAWAVEPVQYVANGGATLRLTARAQDAATGRVEERRFYAKVYNDEERGEQSYQVHLTLWDKASAGGMGFTVARPITYLSDLRTLIQEEAPGTSLQDLLLQQGDEATLTVRKVARALAALHLGHVHTLQRRRLQDALSTLEQIGESLQWACPHLRPEFEKIINTVAAGLQEVPPAPTHGDLSLEHILLDGNRLTLLDLEEFADGDPMVDAAQVLAHLTAMPLHSPLTRARAWAVARAFGGEYFARVPETWRTRFPLRYAGAVLEVALGFFHSQQPGWPDKIEALAEEAKESLAGKSRHLTW